MSTCLRFRLKTDKDGWPPAGAESIPVEPVGNGFRVLVAPFFVKDISVNDVIGCEFDEEGYVARTDHKQRSGRSTIWVVPRNSPTWEAAKTTLLNLGCNIESLKQFGISSIDLPEDVSLDRLDEVLNPVAADGGFIAYPSLRHGQ